MKKANFVHLHVHSHYSLLDGASTTDGIIDAARRLQMPAVALTDHGNLFGAIEFYHKALHRGIKPIVGYEAYLAPGKFDDKETRGPAGETSYHLTLLVKNEKGYQNLLKLASLAYLKGFYYKPRIDKDLLAQHKEGLICLSGCLHSEIARWLVNGQIDQAAKIAGQYKDIFNDDYYLEFHNHGIKEQARVIQGEVELSKRLGIPLVATNDVHYLNREDSRVQDILLCISTNKMVNEPDRLRMSTDEFYFKTAPEMEKLFSEIPEAIENSISIADRCNLELIFNERHLPRFEPPEGKSADEFIRELCIQGLRTRYDQVTESIKKRLDYELEVVEKTGFIDYFLIVWDFIRFARENNISVGPGRGSAAGSLLAYVLGITDIDPLKYDLLFERFMNPGRNEPPDIDIDFSQEGREQVINYVRKKYGQENVAQIITFGTMKARAAVRDVGRVMGFPFPEVDRIAKKIHSVPGITLKEAIELDHELKEMRQSRRDVKELFDISMKIEGLCRHASTHAAGVVIADKPLVTYVPLYRGEETNTTQYPMDILQKIGMLKVDLLGIITLTVIDKCLDIISHTRGEKIDIQSIPLDDPATYKLLGQGETKGVFQLESLGMRDLLQKMKPDCFEDIIALLALYRPGPLKSGMVDDYIKRKHKQEEISYICASLEPILKETNGVILYQEQVMRIANKLGGFSLPEADDLRKAMGKKIPALILPYRERFVTGAVKNRVPESTAHQVFDRIEYFAGYGFNKSHSAAYALTSYRTAYLKANYPVEYMAALMTCHRTQTDKIVEYIEECKRLGIEILPPDVNESYAEFTVVGNKIRFGLCAVKNVGEKAVNAIIEVRKESGPFQSLYDFCERVDTRMVDKLVIESFTKCGAFDSLGAKRAQLMSVLEEALKIGTQKQHDRRFGQLNVFAINTANQATPEATGYYPPLSQETEWPEETLLKYEKDSLGFYVTGHPLVKYEKTLKDLSSVSINDLPNLKTGTSVKIGGIITASRSHLSRRASGKTEKRIHFKFKDLTGVVDAVIYPTELKKYRELIHNDKIVFLKGNLDFQKGESLIKVKEVAPVDRAYEELANNVMINLTLAGLEDRIIHGLKDIFLAHPGTCPVFLRLTTPENQRISIKVSNNYFISPSRRFMSDVDELIGSGHLTFNQ